MREKRFGQIRTKTAFNCAMSYLLPMLGMTDTAARNDSSS
jgi:hypothetical protein